MSSCWEQCTPCSNLLEFTGVQGCSEAPKVGARALEGRQRGWNYFPHQSSPTSRSSQQGPRHPGSTCEVLDESEPGKGPLSSLCVTVLNGATITSLALAQREDLVTRGKDRAQMWERLALASLPLLLLGCASLTCCGFSPKRCNK
jgi:hypothetical protein